MTETWRRTALLGSGGKSRTLRKITKDKKETKEEETIEGEINEINFKVQKGLIRKLQNRKPSKTKKNNEEEEEQMKNNYNQMNDYKNRKKVKGKIVCQTSQLHVVDRI